MNQTIIEDEITIDKTLLLTLTKQRLRAWALKGPLLILGLILLGMLLVPQTFTATSSVAIQQPAGSNSPLSLLAGQAPTKRYLGVLKSRWAAQQVEKSVHLQQLYGLPTHEKAIEMLIASVKPEDNATDGLLYINVALRGPARLGLHATARRERIKEAAAQTANVYTEALRLYYLTNDTERDSVLLRGADVEQRRARADYDDAAARLSAFARSLGNVDPRSAPAPTTSPNSSSPETSPETVRLYEALAQVETEIHASEAAQDTQQRLVTNQLNSLSDIPTEDPLLTQARNLVSRDKTEIANLNIQYGPDNPSVLTAQEKLHIDETRLQDEVSGVRHSLTTEQVQIQSNLERLHARQAELLTQIAQAERRLRVRRNLSVEFAHLQTEAELRFEVLKTTVAEAAKVRLDNVSAQSRMSVMDAASIDDMKAQPSVLILAGAALFLSLLVFGGLIIKDYLSQTNRLGSTATPSTMNVNGTGSEVIETPSMRSKVTR